MHIGFLFNHYKPHQVYHSAPVAFALAQEYPHAEVTIITSDTGQQKTVEKIARLYPGHKCRIVQAHVPVYARLLDKMLRKIVLIRKWAVLKSNAGLFEKMDVLVVPEKTSLTLRKNPKLTHLKFVRIRHGAGDRPTGLNEQQDGFDLILASGEKAKRRLVEDAGISPDKITVTGYPKFDAVPASQPERIFKDGKPVVLYNPHFKKTESSFPRWGRDVLEFFKSSPDYNLIFAPHVVLYLRGLRHGAIDLTPYQGYPNIHLDTGSENSVDMTYLNQADIYLGDVSSQIYEFIYRPRPCVFLNAHGITDWQDNPCFRHWKAGEVIEDIKQLGPALSRAPQKHEDHYRQVQQDLLSDTFSITNTPASLRSARAIMDFFTPG